MPIRSCLRTLPLALLAAGLAGLATAQSTRTPIVIDPEAIAAQAREAAREMSREAHEMQREIARRAREVAEQLRDLDFDAASLAFVVNEFGGRSEIVKNAPYTAEAVSESVQVLSDGNRIVRESRALLARDSFGRTRQEKKAPGASIYIFDPIEGKSHALNPERRVAIRIPRVPAPPIPPEPPVPPAPPRGIAPTPEPRVDLHPDRPILRRPGAGEEDVRVQVMRIGRGEGPVLGPPQALTLPLLPRGKGETRSLGTRDFGGVKAEGTQTTHTIAAGQIGNERPIVISTERWFSPELHIVVFAKTVDPRVGESSYRLVNLKREEPPAELFRVPPDYKAHRPG